MLEELKRKKKLKELESTFDDAEVVYLSSNPNPKGQYYSELEEHIPYGAGEKMAKKSIVKSLDKVFKDENDFADAMGDNIQKKEDPSKGAVDVFEENEKKNQKKMDMLGRLYKKRGVS